MKKIIVKCPCCKQSQTVKRKGSYFRSADHIIVKRYYCTQCNESFHIDKLKTKRPPQKRLPQKPMLFESKVNTQEQLEKYVSKWPGIIMGLGAIGVLSCSLGAVFWI